MATVATIRCPRCGNEVRGNYFTCTFCGKRLRKERIEEFYLFKRIEEEWVTPLGFFEKLIYLFINPSRAFWDINHLRKKSPGYFILLFNSLTYGLIGLATASHVSIQSVINSMRYPSLAPLILYILFFLFGFVYQSLLYLFLIWIYGKAANYSVNFSERLEQRFGGESIEKQQYKDRKLSPFSIYKGGTLLQTQKPYKTKMFMCAFVPFLIINPLNALILAIGLPDIYLSAPSGSADIFLMLFDPNSSVWAAVHIIEFIIMGFWVPLLMTIAIRELSNSSTLRVLVSSYIVGILIAIFFYLLRPTLLGY
ncbi:MAG: conserved membrane protein of unknown function [Promethearchaeota archaeon]|nr:MAG: conserved membrane protein of unknown function [Candidatus Lokiarchaeota archaeon]